MFPGMHFIIYLLDTWNEKNINEYVGFFFLSVSVQVVFIFDWSKGAFPFFFMLFH